MEASGERAGNGTSGGFENKEMTARLESRTPNRKTTAQRCTQYFVCAPSPARQASSRDDIDWTKVQALLKVRSLSKFQIQNSKLKAKAELVMSGISPRTKGSGRAGAHEIKQNQEMTFDIKACVHGWVHLFFPG